LGVARKVAATIGADFFLAIAKHLAKAVVADCVLIGEFMGGPMEGVRSLGAFMDGQPASFEYEMAESASARVALGKPCQCRSDAALNFPGDQLIPMVKAQALLGLPLVDIEGRPIGIIMALFRRPMDDFHMVKQLLLTFSARAAAELNRKLEEDQLRQSEQRYRAFIARNADAMWRLELESPIDTSLPEEEQLNRMYRYGYVAECNDALAHMVGKERAAQVIGARLEEIFPSSDPAIRETVLNSIRHHYEFTALESTRVDPSGNRRHFLKSECGIIDDGKLERVWGTTRDITELKESEQALDASERRMTDLLETMKLAVIVENPDGAVIYCNRHFYESTAWRPIDVIGKPVDTLVPADERERLTAVLERGRAKPARPIHFECKLQGPKGQNWQFEWDRTVLRDHEDGIAGWASVGRDVTERDALEVRLRQTQKLATIGKLAGGVAHDFNNLLTVILGYSARLLADRDRLDAETCAALEEVRKAASKGAELTHRLLAFSRRQILRPELLNLNPLILESEQMLRRLIGDEVRLTTNLGASLGSVLLDGSSFHQVLMNLAVNARDAMPDGGKLTISTANATLDGRDPASPVSPGNYVLVTVSDTGTGMTSDVLDHLYEPFFTTKNQGKGTGLGLSMVYGIVQQSGGTIVVNTEVSRGTTFRIYFPRVEGAAQPAPKTDADGAAQRGSETILLVEDREDVRRFVLRALRDLGYKVLEADGSPRALELCQDRSRTIDLLLTDISMPGMTGFELADHVRNYHLGIRFLFMSGYADPSRFSGKLNQHGGAYLQKPFTVPVLAGKIREVLDSRQSRGTE
jgi:two-component system cell cycle sensor histidine kinase/response regulator CckA